jgi:IS5 family transposase
VPHPTTLVKLVGRAGPEVIGQLNAALLDKLAKDRLLRGRKLQVDTTPTQFGYTLPLGEDERGFIADHQLEQGNPPDAAQLVPAVERVVQLTCRVPGTVVGDRGFGSAANDSALAQLGVARIGLQRNGTRGKARRALERTRAFRRMRNWRVGIEARISHLKRGFGLRRARLRRLAGARTWVGLGVLAYNLQRMTVTAR